MLDEATKTKIEFEIAQISMLLEKASVLVSKCKNAEPDFVELAAAGSILHSFYNGVESIFVLIQKHIDKKPLGDGAWHKELLENMFRKTENRGALLSSDLKNTLNEYMSFRHVFRHSYGHTLRWEKMQHLFLEMEKLWFRIKEQLEIFCHGQS